MSLHVRPIAFGLIAAIVMCSSSLAQNPPAGSFGAGTAGVNGIPIGPGAGTGLNNSVNDPSGFGNAAKMPPLPSQATIPRIPEAASVSNGGSSVRSPAAVSQISPQELTSLRGARAKAVARDRKRLLDKDLTSICRGC
jgi:hypothetical protein